MFNSAFHTTILLAVLFDTALAVPRAQPAGLVMPLRRRGYSPQSVNEWGEWAKAHRERLESKYGGSDHNHARRATGTNLCVDLSTRPLRVAY